LARSYLAITKDLTRVMHRLKAVYRSWAIPRAGTRVYAAQGRAEWLKQLPENGVRRRAERLFVRSAPKPPALPSEVWINKPVSAPAPLSVEQANETTAIHFGKVKCA